MGLLLHVYIESGPLAMVENQVTEFLHTLSLEYL